MGMDIVFNFWDITGGVIAEKREISLDIDIIELEKVQLSYPRIWYNWFGRLILEEMFIEATNTYKV